MTADSINRDDVELGSLYRDTVLDHFRSPRGRKKLDRVDLSRLGQGGGEQTQQQLLDRVERGVRRRERLIEARPGESPLRWAA